MSLESRATAKQLRDQSPFPELDINATSTEALHSTPVGMILKLALLECSRKQEGAVILSISDLIKIRRKKSYSMEMTIPTAQAVQIACRALEKANYLYIELRLIMVRQRIRASDLYVSAQLCYCF